eukprot:TRINITY_DN7584_c0_g2_i3.p1 TRINITY_DN7584_c0_g2~~TRINITY_DN7584_c0_g2_i3.p1  ORF type:complete len:133 (+),score=21.91 TRINITY_DN7584_c0_g2_i3:34-399(+)
MIPNTKTYKSFAEFYPFYLSEHLNNTNRLLHFTGTTLVLVLVLSLLLTGSWSLLVLLPLCGYGFAWVGHFFFEKNKPASFKFPFYSLIGDFVMWFEILTGKIPLRPGKIDGRGGRKTKKAY